MGLRILKQAEIDAAQKERILFYGRAGIGKSRTVLSLPEKKYGKIAYYAADDNSEFLASISPEKRKRIIVVKPDNTDPIQNFMAFAMQDWKKTVDPEIGTLVVDTYTQVAMDCIRYSANTSAMTAERHFVVGDPNNGGQTIPNRGDYMAIESLSRGFLDMLFDKQRDMHIIFVCHEDIKMVEGIHAVGGPAHPGRAMAEALPAAFNTVFRLIRESILIPGASAPQDVVIAIGENDGKFIAKVRTTNEADENPLARVILNKSGSNLWELFDSTFSKETANVV